MLAQPHPIDRIPGRHIGEHDLVAIVQPETISIVLTELRPIVTSARGVASAVEILKSAIVLCSCPKAGRPTCTVLSTRSSSIVPSTVRSGTAPRGKGR